jgi:hypothetical protein
MVMDPTPAWVVVRDGKVVYIRTQQAIAEASANIERTVYGYSNIQVVPVLMTEVEDVTDGKVS